MMRKMRGARLSILVFGIYIIAIGVPLAIAPNPILALVGLPPTDEVWLRIAGALAALIGSYYLRAAREDVRAFFRWTVGARAVIPPLFAVFVLAGLARPTLMLFAVGDAAGATWTYLALRSDARGAR